MISCDPPGGCLRYFSHTPVEEPRCLGAGQGGPEAGSLRCHGSILKHPPGKVPLLRSPEGDGIAVHCALQVGMDPDPHNMNNTRQGQGFKPPREGTGFNPPRAAEVRTH